MAKTNGIVEDFTSLLKAESAITDKLNALEAEAEKLRVERNRVVIGWLQKHGTASKDRLGRSTFTRKPFGHAGVTYQVLMAYQKGDDQGQKPNGYVRRISAGDLE